MISYRASKPLHTAKKQDHIILSLQGCMPTVVHPDYEAALVELERLSTKHPNRDFILLRIVKIKRKHIIHTLPNLQVSDIELKVLPITLIEQCSNELKYRWIKLNNGIEP